MPDVGPVTGMTAGGWTMLGLAWGGVFCLLLWCYYRTLTLKRLEEDDPSDSSDE